MKHASEDIRNLAISLYKSGKYTQQQVADIVGYHLNTIKSWLRIDALGGPQRPRERGHRPRILNRNDLLRLQALVNSGTCSNLDELTNTFGKGSRSVIHRALMELGFTYKKKQFSPTSAKVPR